MEINLNSSPVEKDEIVSSLKRFGVKCTYINENQTHQSLQEIMQDFSLNGLVFIEVKKQKSTTQRSVTRNSFNDYIYGKMKIKHSFNKINKSVKYSNYYKSCVFCENNNEPEAVYKSHSVRDSLGNVLCPKLRTYICPICGASGDTAHTVKYCPCKPIITMEDTIKYENSRVTRTAFVKQEVKY